MSDRYAATGEQAAVTASPGDSTISIQSTTADRPEIYDLVFSQGAAPADTVIQWLVRTFDTADGTGTAVTPTPIDMSGQASALTVLEDHSAEPTDASEAPILDFDLNQRATFRWVAAPGGELKLPAIATEGIYVTPISATYSGIARTSAHWIE